MLVKNLYGWCDSVDIFVGFSVKMYARCVIFVCICGCVCVWLLCIPFAYGCCVFHFVYGCCVLYFGIFVWLLFA